MHTLELPQWAEVGAGAREGQAGRSTNWTLGVVEQEGRRKGREPAQAQGLLRGQRPWPQTSLCRQGLWIHSSPKGLPSLTPIPPEEPNLSLLGPGL